MSENNTLSTRSAILREALSILEASARPLHYKELSKLITWEPDPGARTEKANSVYFYLYEDDQERGRVVFLRRGCFGLRSRKYTDEQIKAAVPARKSNGREREQMVIEPTKLTPEQVAMLKSMGILAK